MLFDINNYLTDDILCKVDRAAMSNSLETRASNARLCSSRYCFKMPLNLKINNNTNKYILKKYYKNIYLKNILLDQKWVFQYQLVNF